MTDDRTIPITGVTGNQGCAVARVLQGPGFHLRGLTRTPDSQRAAALARQGIDIVQAISMTRRRCAVRWPPGVHGMSPSGPGAARRKSHGKIVIRVA